MRGQRSRHHATPSPRRVQNARRLKEITLRLRLIAPVVFVLVVTGVAFVLAPRNSTADALLVLATGLAIAAVTATVIATSETRHSRALLADEQAALRRVAT